MKTQSLAEKEEMKKINSNFRAEGHDTVVYWSGYIEASIRTESLRARERKVLYSIVNLKPQKNMHRHRLMLWGLCFSG